ncbi:AIG2-like (avirulence induced gene) family protein [Euphorbia peplus]|nr:AIG2-like (avirulence induced gene) family protein [Euphorbia peplus]
MGIDNEQDRRLIFTYGTLKNGFSNHCLMQDLIRTGDAVFKGIHRTVENYPLVCGPYRVPFLLNLPGASGSQRVSGEVYAVTDRGLARLDELEGTTRSHYERSPITVEEEGGGGGKAAEAYYAHRSYAMEMWKRNGKRGYGVYGEKEANGYVKRKDRPQNLSFLEQIHVFINSSIDDNNNNAN